MFSFGRESKYRLDSLRHNPYVGSFHSVDRKIKSTSSSMLLDSSLKNPFIGTVRHSPAGTSVGLKGLLWEEEPWKAPVMSQVKLSREKKYSNRHASTSLLASIPITLFRHTDAALPICGICLDTFVDGDELRPLPCSHCFHRACVDEWLLGLKSDERTYTNNCPCCRQDISPGSSIPDLGMTSFSFPHIDDEDNMSIATSSSPTAGCAIPKESFHRLGQYLSASDIGTSNTLCERFQDEDSNITSDVDSEAAVDSGISVQDPQNVPQEGNNIIRSESQNDSMSRISVDLGSMDSPQEESRFYDISLSADQGDRDPTLELITHSNCKGDQEVGRNVLARTHRDRLVLTENHFNSTGSRASANEDMDSGEEEGVSVSDDDECILRASRLSNLSICTATHDVDVLLKRRADQLAADNKNKGRIARSGSEEDAEGSVVSDMEEEYFMGYSHSDTPIPTDVLAGSLYSDCGVPLRAVTRRGA